MLPSLAQLINVSPPALTCSIYTGVTTVDRSTRWKGGSAQSQLALHHPAVVMLLLSKNRPSRILSPTLRAIGFGANRLPFPASGDSIFERRRCQPADSSGSTTRNSRIAAIERNGGFADSSESTRLLNRAHWVTSCSPQPLARNGNSGNTAPAVEQQPGTTEHKPIPEGHYQGVVPVCYHLFQFVTI